MSTLYVRNKCTRCGGAFGGHPEAPRDPQEILCFNQQSCDDNIVARVTRIYNAAAADLGPDLQGGSVLDLVADQLPHLSLEELRLALSRAGFTKYEVSSCVD